MKYIMSFLGKMLPYIVCFAVLYLPLRLLSLKRPSSLSHETALLLLLISVVAILSQTLTPDGGFLNFSFDISLSREYFNIVPFMALKRLAALRGTPDFEYFLLINILGNILIFAPIGFFYRWVRNVTAIRAALAGAALSVFIEVFQVLLPRATDVDDVIMNTLGALLGAWLFGLCRRIYDARDQKR